ncbi:2-hydroxycarboxylate transporter family protein [Acidibrevibacterium fodinaquatile]|uniref:2-hydroxycarboxylate transporter family protein n=1 Tax=Acidibrevibacterium fodinaquatile TaxID=1969806 RepID=UPI0019634BBA|nr:2-hydroxycarboxylate transporter family protein [Acidibrevibacterium fodinaquatile]
MTQRGMSQTGSAEHVPPKTGARALWWRLVDGKVGIIPLPLYPVILVLIAALVGLGKVPPDLTTMIPLIALGAFTAAEIGKRVPGLARIGGPAILTVFLPSYLVHAHLMPEKTISAISVFSKQSNFLYLFIACIIVGSILGMHRRVLIAGFLKIFVPLFAGSLAALIAGTLVGTLLGLGWRHSLFFIVIPIMGGGIGEGALPLSLGYATVLHAKQGDMFATILPAVLLGNLAALLISGALATFASRRPALTGYGRLQPEAAGDALALPPDPEDLPTGHPPDATTVAAAGITAITLYLVGIVVQDVSGFPAPVLMLALAVGLKLARAVSARLREGAGVIYGFFAQCVTYPLIFAIGVAMTPWDKLVAALQPEIIAVIVVTVATIIAVGFFVGRLVGLYPIEAAIVNACHSGQGGTGDVMILSAANRMELMPFAQIATRIGGAITVTLALTALRMMT